MQFRWTPGAPLNAAAIARMKSHFHKPESDPPVAWFMSMEQEYYDGLHEAIAGSPPDIRYMEIVLHDLGGGIKNFGPMQEWHDWYLHLLPFLLERIFEGELLLLTLDYCFNLYPDMIGEEYPGFREDVLNTLPQCIMAPHLWANGDLATEHWWFDSWAGYWTPAFNASMIFCMKYMTNDEIPVWIESLASIQGDTWKQNVLYWLRGVRQMERFQAHPETVPPAKDEIAAGLESIIVRGLRTANLDWNASYLLFNHEDGVEAFDRLVSQSKREVLWHEVAKYPHFTLEA
jgi:hypothetical protein